MAKVNKKHDPRVDPVERLAGGFGMPAATQDAYALLRRSVLACLLWENVAYENGKSVVDNIKQLIPQVDPQKCADLAIEARTMQKLRHVPLLIAREMLRYPKHRVLVGALLPKIVLRADEITELVALYFKEGKRPIPKQMKKGLREAFHSFKQYHFSKYNRDGSVHFRDVMFLVHPEPQGEKEADLFKMIADDKLPPADTWEVALSAGKDKKATWEKMIIEKTLPALAFLRNLRNMDKAGVDRNVVQQGFDNFNGKWIVPINYIAAMITNPHYSINLMDLMLADLSQREKLPGRTAIVVDVSGSMCSKISSGSDMERLDIAVAFAIIAKELCETSVIYATAGSDGEGKHQTAKLDDSLRGMQIADAIYKYASRPNTLAGNVRRGGLSGILAGLGGGGIFTRQCLEYIKAFEKNQNIDRIIVLSDSQDCDRTNKIPNPFGATNYVIDVSAESRGIAYKDVWTAEISGWSDHVFDYIYEFERMIGGNLSVSSKADADDE